MKSPFAKFITIAATAVAIAVGLIVLLGYFLPQYISEGLRTTLVGWAVILAGVATLVGVFNLIVAHLHKVSSPSGRDFYSVFLILAFVITLVVGLILSPSDPNFQVVVTSIQAPIETSLMAVLAISLAYAGLRLLQRRKGWMPVLFAISAVVFLILGSGLFAGAEGVPGLGAIVGFLNRLPIAGARGILLGVALGSLTTGLRILFGADRPYSG